MVSPLSSMVMVLKIILCLLWFYGYGSMVNPLSSMVMVLCSMITTVFYGSMVMVLCSMITSVFYGSMVMVLCSMINPLASTILWLWFYG